MSIMACALNSNDSPPRTIPDDLLKSLRKFSSDRVKMESEGKKWSKQVIDKYVKGEIDQYFQKTAKIKIREYVYTGSAFESLKTEAADEADVMIVLRVGKTDVTFEPEVPGYYRLKANKGSSLVNEKLVDDKNFVFPEKVISWFFGLVIKAVDEIASKNPGSKLELKVRRHGPAVQMDVVEGSKNLSIDLVPAIEFTEPKEHVVAKTYPSHASKQPQCDPKLLWRRSFSAKEKALLSDMDKVDQGCRKELLRIVKTLIRQEPTFSKLTSYHLKTAFLSYKASIRSDGEWHKDKLAKRFLEFLHFLRNRLAKKVLSHYWIPELNLLDGITEKTLENMETRLHKIHNSDKELAKLLGNSGTTMKTSVRNNSESVSTQTPISSISLLKSPQQSCGDLLKILRKLSSSCLKTESEETRHIKQILKKYVEGEINQFFQKNAKIEIKEFDFTGSEVADVAEVMTVLGVEKTDVTFEPDAEVPGCYRLKANEGSFLADRKLSNEDKIVSPEKVISWFIGLVQKTVDDVASKNPGSKSELKVRRHGPAVQMDVTEGSKTLSIDLVPAIEFTEPKEHVVAKTYPSHASKQPQCDTKLLWRRSFSAKEKALLSDMDKVDQGCRKELLRIVKTLIRQEPTFSKLTSDHLKTAFLSYKTSIRSDGEWHKDKLVERFLEFLHFLRNRLAEKVLSHSWIPELNLLDGIAEKTLENMETRLARILGNESEMHKVLSSCASSKHEL